MQETKQEKVEQLLQKPAEQQQIPTEQQQPTAKEEQEDFVVNPYTMSSSTNKEIDYNKLIVKFGCSKFTQEHVKRIEKLTGKQPHYFLTREIFVSHRDLDVILDAYENNKDPNFPAFYLYTGRGPSSEALHLGHMLPFIYCKWMQEVFNVPFIIQITDDQKYFHKEGGDLQEFTNLAYENIKDILAIGFDPENTFICLDSKYMGSLYPNVCRFQRHINMTTLRAIFGLQFSDNCGKAAYPAIQAAPCLSSSFPHFFGNKNIPCLIPCGIDQDPYFRMTRDVCSKIKAPKPAGLYNKFFPSLQGFGSKMSGSVPQSGIFMTDTPKEIENKIKKHAFSGGKATKEEQELHGAQVDIDISYQYLKFFLEDDKQLEDIRVKYSTGKMLTGQIKKILIKVLQKFVGQHQQNRKKITMQVVQQFLSTHPRKYAPKV